MNQTFKWTRKNLQELRDAILGLISGYNTVFEKLNTGVINQKQVFVFLKGEYRFWRSIKDWESFFQNWKLIEGIDFEYVPKGAFIGFTQSGKPEDFCGDKAGRFFRRNWLPNFQGFDEIKFVQSASLEFSEGSMNNATFPFIPTLELPQWFNFASKESRRLARGESWFPAQAGYPPFLFDDQVSINDADTWLQGMTYWKEVVPNGDTSQGLPPRNSWWVFNKCNYSGPLYTYCVQSATPSFFVPARAIELDIPTEIVHNGIDIGGGKDIPLPPHIDVVCIKFLRQITLSSLY